MTASLAQKLLDPTTGNLANGMPDLNSEAARLIQTIFASPYRYPLIDLDISMKSLSR